MSKIITTISLLSLMVFMSITLASCGKNTIKLPNGYKLSIDKSEKTFVVDNLNLSVFRAPVSAFFVNSECIYGWLDNSAENLFFLDTKNSNRLLFDSSKELDAYLVEKNLPQLTMKNSFTFLDITTGHKKKTW
jgi:hypothetical protein